MEKVNWVPWMYHPRIWKPCFLTLNKVLFSLSSLRTILSYKSNILQWERCCYLPSFLPYFLPPSLPFSLPPSFPFFLFSISKLKDRREKIDLYWHLTTWTWGSWSLPGGYMRFFTWKWINALLGIPSGEMLSSKNISTRVEHKWRQWKGREWWLMLSIWQNREPRGELASVHTPTEDCLHYTNWQEKTHLNCGLDYSLGCTNGKSGQAPECKQLLLLSDSQCDMISWFLTLLHWLPIMMDLELWVI